MDYKEEYHNALERAKKGLPIDEVFPELKESEDERIRKELIEAIERALVFDIDKEVADRWIAYLERQKEKKPSSYSNLEITNVVRKALQECEGFNNCRPDVYAARVGATVEGLLQEQKPAEWSEEDEKYLNRVINLWVNDFGEDSDTVKWLKSLKPSWKPSEEQMDALEHFIRSWGESGTMSPQNPTLCAAKTLLNDLKKL